MKNMLKTFSEQLTYTWRLHKFPQSWLRYTTFSFYQIQLDKTDTETEVLFTNVTESGSNQFGPVITAPSRPLCTTGQIQLLASRSWREKTKRMQAPFQHPGIIHKWKAFLILCWLDNLWDLDNFVYLNNILHLSCSLYEHTFRVRHVLKSTYYSWKKECIVLDTRTC